MGETAGAQLRVTSETWDQPDTWKKPEWYTATGARVRLKHYTDHRRQRIRIRFAETEAEFRVCLSEPEGRNSPLIGKSLFDSLVTARQTLEGKLTIWSNYGADSKSSELRGRDVHDSRRRYGPRRPKIFLAGLYARVSTNDQQTLPM